LINFEQRFTKYIICNLRDFQNWQMGEV